MAHEEVFGICANKCLVPVYSKEQTDDELNKKAPTNHNHDTSYYKKTETYSQAQVNEKFAVKEITLGTTWNNGLQTVNVTGITANDSPILTVKLSGDFDTVLEQRTEWNKIVQATTGNGTITFLSSEDTEIALTVLVKGV